MSAVHFPWPPIEEFGANADQPGEMPSTEEAHDGSLTPRTPGKGTAAVHAFALLAAVALAIATAGTDRWKLAPLVTIMAFALLSDLAAVLASRGVYVSGSFLGIVLAAVTLGGGPAAVIGVSSICVGWFRSREAGHYFRNNLATYAWFPLITGLVFHAAMQATGIRTTSIEFSLLVFGAFVLALACNVALTGLYQVFVRRATGSQLIHDVLAPLLAAELFSGILTVAAAYIDINAGTIGLVFCAIVFLIFQYLIGELLKSKHRGDALQRAAITDDLTGLPNRERFRDVIEARIAAARSTHARFAVLLMDLDRFKDINDTLGHHYGDSLLRDLGPRLVSAIGDGGLVARLGGDEFGLLLAQETDDPAVLDVILDRLIASISVPFVVDELSLELGVSIGVARFPRDGGDAHALLRCADIAMYTAKDTQTDYKLYAAEQNQHSVRRLSVLSDIRHALASDEIIVHYQPIIDLDDLRVRGAEGLVRWQHPEHGLIPPAAFVQTVEQTGLIGPLTRHVLEHSIAECASWRRDGRELSVAVNLSVRNLLDGDLPKQIERLLTTYSLPPEALQLEITESMIMSDPERALATVTRLSALGVRLSVDDFGTGYSSLANLRKMPINELKIDRSFVAPMLRDESDLIIVRSTINLGHDLGLNVIAEGVEDSATLSQLAELGCDLAQGYHVSRPMPADAFNAWLTHSARHGAGRTEPSTPVQPTRAAAVAPAAIARGAVDLSRPAIVPVPAR